MAMSKKHYEAVAKLLQRRFELFRKFAAEKPTVHVSVAKDAFGLLANDLADLFAQDNRNFDRKRFVHECCRLSEYEIARNIARNKVDGIAPIRYIEDF